MKVAENSQQPTKTTGTWPFYYTETTTRKETPLTQLKTISDVSVKIFGFEINHYLQFSFVNLPKATSSQGIKCGLKTYPISLVLSLLGSYVVKKYFPAFAKRELEALYKIKNNYYSNDNKWIFQTVIVAPIFEELFNRNIVHNGLQKSIKYLAPSINASKIASIASSIIFGAEHYYGTPNNEKAGRVLQSIIATFTGLHLAKIYNNYGLIGSISAHMTHNALASTYLIYRQVITK